MAKRSHWRTYLVEHYWPGVTEAEFRASAQRVADSADRLAHAGEPVRFLHSTLVPEDEAAFCVLTAWSAAVVEQVYAGAGVTYERLVEAIESEPRAASRLSVPVAIHQSEEEPSWTSVALPGDP
jgi:hypothetical protein